MALFEQRSGNDLPQFTVDELAIPVTALHIRGILSQY
jgi:hypothetical protein